MSIIFMITLICVCSLVALYVLIHELVFHSEEETRGLRNVVKSFESVILVIGRWIYSLVKRAACFLCKCVKVELKGWDETSQQPAVDPWQLQTELLTILGRLQVYCPIKFLIPTSLSELQQCIRAYGNDAQGNFRCRVELTHASVTSELSAADLSLVHHILVDVCAKSNTALIPECICLCDDSGRHVLITFLHIPFQLKPQAVTALKGQLSTPLQPTDYEALEVTAEEMLAGKVGSVADASGLQMGGYRHWYAPEQMWSLLVCGRSGTGKSTFLLLHLLRLQQLARKTGRTARFILIDYKGEFRADFEGCDWYYGPENFMDGIRVSWEQFQDYRQHPDRQQSEMLCIIHDEYAATVEALDKKAADELKKQLGTMLRLNRSLGIHICIGMQDVNAKHFGDSGARDQFAGIVALGTLSPEQRRMLFPGFEGNFPTPTHRGEGLYRNFQQEIFRVQVPFVSNRQALITDLLSNR